MNYNIEGDKHAPNQAPDKMWERIKLRDQDRDSRIKDPFTAG